MPSTKTLNQSPTIGATENADLLWIWDNSAAELTKISLGNLLTTTALLNGRSGGQTLIGGTAANDDLTLEGTSNATRTTSYVVLQPNDGNVGIGTTTPTAKLEVNGNIKLSGPDGATATPSFIWLGNDYSDGTTRDKLKIYLYSSGAAQYGFSVGVNQEIQYHSVSIHDFYVSNVNALRINSSGNVGIGTTSPDTRLDIDAGAIQFAEMTAPAAGAANTGRLFCRDNGSGKTQLCVIFNTGAIQVIATQP